MSKFTGPLFIVGIPRSGTKLLRGLINRNPEINIPLSETNFLPIMIKKYGNPPCISDDSSFYRFYQDYRRTTFNWWMKKYGHEMSFKDLKNNANRKSWTSLFEQIIRYHTDDIDANHIWGDKSPSYIFHMRKLKEVFKNAKFINIIRDPRDCCLSMKKAWGINYISGANIWTKGIKIAREDSEILKYDYLEIYYEELISKPKATLMKVCSFLGRKYNDSMLELETPCEDIANTKNEKNIVSTNKNNYKLEMSDKEIENIEEITYELLLDMPYNVYYAKRHKPTSTVVLKIMEFLRVINRIKYDTKTKGISGMIKYFIGVIRLKLSAVLLGNA